MFSRKKFKKLIRVLKNFESLIQRLFIACLCGMQSVKLHKREWWFYSILFLKYQSLKSIFKNAVIL